LCKYVSKFFGRKFGNKTWRIKICEGNLEIIHKVENGTTTMQKKVGCVTSTHFSSKSVEVPVTKIIFTEHVQKLSFSK
jgi:hypothetical protein